MTLKIFEEKLREQCERLYVSLRDGSRAEKLKIKKINSLTDVVFLDRISDKKTFNKMFTSCIITFGNVLERATMNYAETMKANVYKHKTFLAADIDIVFRIRQIVYNLESKSNIELDLGKTKKALETLQRKHKIVWNALDCQNEKWQVISKFVVWTKQNSKEARDTAKRPLEEKHLMGFKDFFNLFNIKISKDNFFKMIQNVWLSEVEKYF